MIGLGYKLNINACLLLFSQRIFLGEELCLLSR
jgi:hypothetical protein